MSNKELVAKVGLVTIIFLLFLLVLDSLSPGSATLSAVSVTLANVQSLELLWTVLATATLLQAFVIFAALLGANLQFTPVQDDHGGDH